MSGLVTLGVAGIYLYLLFALAFYIDSRTREAGRGAATGGAWIYALSIAVYCTSWTFYGSVGRSSVSGIGFLPVYIGPILVFIVAQPVLQKILHICKAQHITSIADLISARYGKSQALAGLVTVIAVIGIVPYISLQLKAVSLSYDIVSRYPAVTALAAAGETPFWADSAFYVAATMSLFVIAFGTRHVDATEQHRGMVTAVALESLVKLAAFVIVGAFITFGMFDGFANLFSRASAEPAIAPLLDVGRALGSVDFWSLTVLSMLAIVCLPRQFQVTIVENQDAGHLRKASWLFPLYLVAINIFVLPIALAGLLTFTGQGVNADTFVLTLPIAAGSPTLAILAFVGGLSASTAMLIVETIALATMICNDLVMPLLIRGALINTNADAGLGGLVKGIRRASIAIVLLLGYLYVRLVGEGQALVSIGLMSFVAVAQFAPALIGALYWKGGTQRGAMCGLVTGFLIWAYTILLPSFQLTAANLADPALLGWPGLHPHSLFGLVGMNPVTHGLFWSLLANTVCFVTVSLYTQQGVLERGQALAFVDASAAIRPALAPRAWDADVRVGNLMAMIGRFVEPDRAQRAYAEYARERNLSLDPTLRADAEFINFAERLLAGAIGSALARVIVASEISERTMGVDGVMDMLSDASQAIEAKWEILREAVENIDQGISVFDADLRLTVWNRRFLELHGLPAHLAAHGTPYEIFIRYNAERGEYGPGNIEDQIAERLALARRNQPHRFERERPNGVVLEIFGKPLPSGGFISTYTDITERKRAERELRRAYDELEQRVDERTHELRESRERFRDLAESASDWFWETDASLRFTFVSDRFYEITRIGPDAVLGQATWNPPCIDEAERRSEDWRQLRADLENHRPLRGFEYAARTGDGERVHFRVTGRPFYDESGIFLGYRGTGTNITELIGAQQELQRTEKLAALGSLVAGVAHEINTPIGVGLTAASYLEEKTRAFQRIYSTGNIRRSDMESFSRTAADTSASLVANLRRAAELVRSFKQVAVDQASEQKRRFNLREYLDEILLSLHPTLKRTRHTVRIDCPEDIVLDSYPGAFSQIVANLIMNSLMHGFEDRPEGEIDIIARLDGGLLTLIYRDNGKGILAEHRGKIFEPFFTTKRGRGGSGLGMNVVYNLVTQTLGGRIRCGTDTGHGVTFTMQIAIDASNNGSGNLAAIGA